MLFVDHRLVTHAQFSFTACDWIMVGVQSFACSNNCHFVPQFLSPLLTKLGVKFIDLKYNSLEPRRPALSYSQNEGMERDANVDSLCSMTNCILLYPLCCYIATVYAFICACD